ncbi:hypothetical protein JNO54_06775 [Janibacter sp. YIM B02568]|uniref:hypothetical protein n=1 Tax=Janibacter endophyticus TaxID=2806261 RepID=UPI00194E07B0|nr:hypothetical protein [Janibacter endophyticus]MBM6545843.1 hypothetical protein [Janibacter endophyticus]
MAAVTSRTGQLLVLSLMLLIFGVGMFGVGTWALWRSAGTGFALLWVAVLTPVVGVLLWALVTLARQGRPPRQGDLRDVPALTRTPSGSRWSFDELAGALAARLADTPCTVRGDDQTIVIAADLADARWRHLAIVRDLQDAFVVTLERVGEGTVRRTDQTRIVEWHAGAPSVGGAQATLRSGREWSHRKRVSYGVTERGVEKPVDYTFSTRDINAPLRSVLRQAGWKTALPTDAKAGLLMAGVVVAGGVLVGIWALVTQVLV